MALAIRRAGPTISGNVWWLGLLSRGQAPAQPASRRPHLGPARGLPHQLDSSARMIWLFERLGWLPAPGGQIADGLPSGRLSHPPDPVRSLMPRLA
jgi:hypothetical protein